jgi:hypothetical protein
VYFGEKVVFTATGSSSIAAPAGQSFEFSVSKNDTLPLQLVICTKDITKDSTVACIFYEQQSIILKR